MEKTEYKGFTIHVEQDEFFDSSDDNAYGELHCDSRDLYIGAIRKNGKEVQKPLSLKIPVQEMLDILDTSRVFVCDYGAHSGVWLNGNPEEITREELLKDARAQYEIDYPNADDKKSYSFNEILYQMETEECTKTQGDVLLILPSDTKDDSVKHAWQYWDDCIHGNVYVFVINDKDCDLVDSCAGFVGDPDTSGLMETARNIIDGINSKEYNTKKYEEEIASTKKRLAEIA